ncbi:hypothetical protein E4U19_006482 [Claviceps sp. Clav32 group G5]|nr:hypothetical protein E4U19_006482 [Claviceps sp. Clav32 group G5]
MNTSDETPIPFDYSNGHTYERERQATETSVKLPPVLYIFGDGVQPKIIFHEAPNGKILEEESHLYSAEVTVEFNLTASNNEELFHKWLDEDLGPLTRVFQKKHLLVMDVVAFHKTPAVKSKLKELGIIVRRYHVKEEAITSG